MLPIAIPTELTRLLIIHDNISKCGSVFSCAESASLHLNLDKNLIQLINISMAKAWWPMDKATPPHVEGLSFENSQIQCGSLQIFFSPRKSRLTRLKHFYSKLQEALAVQLEVRSAFPSYLRIP